MISTSLPHAFTSVIASRFGKLVSCLSVMAAITYAAPAAQSATVFEFGSDSYVSQNVDFERTASFTGSGPYITTVAFDDTTPLSPSSGYTGPTFYGGYTFSSESFPVGFAAQGLFSKYSKIDSVDAIYFNVTGTSGTGFTGTAMRFASVFVFKQSSFNAPFQEGNVSVNGFSISLFKHGGSSAAGRFNPEGRWLVEVDGSYYLSNRAFSTSTNEVHQTFELSGEDLHSTLWAAYDPTSSLNFDLSSAQFQELDLNAVTSVGFYIDEQSFSTNNTVGMRLAVSSFSVTSIPEPGTIAFLAAGIPFLLGYLLRR